MSRSKSTAKTLTGDRRSSSGSRIAVNVNLSNIRRLAVCLAILAPAFAQSPACSIEGRVANLLRGGPVRKATVRLGSKYQAVTDNEGRYAIAGIAPGRYPLSVQRTGFLPTSYGAHAPNRPGKSLLLAPGENRKAVDFFLEPPGVITGHVYDQDGEVLSAPITLYREVWRNGRKRFESSGGAMADDEGEYRIFGLAGGSYLVAVTQTPVRPASPVPTREIYPLTFYPGTEDASAATVIKVGPGGEARNIDIRVRKTVSVNVSGNVVLSGPVGNNVTAALLRPDGIRNQSQLMFPQPSEFSARGVSPGSYVLSVRTSSLYGRLDIDVGTLDIAGLELRLSPLIDLTGFLKFEGEDPPDTRAMSVSLAGPDSADFTPIAHPAEDNTLTWHGLTPGKWTVQVSGSAEYYLKSQAEIEIGPEGHAPIEVVMSSKGAGLTGKVQASPDRPDPVESATVLLFEDTKQPRVVRFAITDADGKYSLNAIPPGKYRLLALEDIETGSWNNPDAARSFEGKGVALELGASEKSARDLLLAQQ